jgi:hypothetical protein
LYGVVWGCVWGYMGRAGQARRTQQEKEERYANPNPNPNPKPNPKPDQARRTQQEKEELQERWVASDAQRTVPMDAATLAYHVLGTGRTPLTLTMCTALLTRR